MSPSVRHLSVPGKRLWKLPWLPAMMEDLPLRLESRPAAAFPQVSHNALDVASRRPQPLGKRSSFSTASTTATMDDPSPFITKGGAESTLASTQRGHFENNHPRSGTLTHVSTFVGIGVHNRRNLQLADILFFERDRNSAWDPAECDTCWCRARCASQSDIEA